MYIDEDKAMTANRPAGRSIGQKIKLALVVLIVSLITVVVIAGLVESYLKYQYELSHPAPGQLFQVQEHKMHIWCEGNGEPTVLLDAGAGMFSSGWRWVMPEISPTNRVCAFDRSGLGWSEPAPPPFDGISAANELHQLLEQANIQKPFVYVGHSLGANMGQIYHHQFPDDLRALFLLEPANPEIFLQEISDKRGTPVVRGAPVSACGFRCVMVSAASALGVIDIAFRQIEAINDPMFHSRALAEFKARTNRSESLAFLAQRGKYITEIMFQSLDSNRFQELPIAIFHSENAGELLGDHTSEQEMRDDRSKGVLAYQQFLDQTGRSMGLIEVKDANHLTMVMYQEPAKQVAAAIIELLQQVENQYLTSYEDT
jgi:pimeloyl-ACP methyl ester carboxylesterase